MRSSGNRTRSVRPGGIQTGISGRMGRTQRVQTNYFVRENHESVI